MVCEYLVSICLVYLASLCYCSFPICSQVKNINIRQMGFQPWVTFNKNNGALEVHPIRGGTACLAAIIELKPQDLATCVKMDFQHQACGLYLSDEFPFAGRSTRVLYLPPHMNQFQDKFQDLLAAVALSLCNLCIFDIGSKYLRHTSKYPLNLLRHNYMLLQGCGNQLHSVNLHHSNNKMEIVDKISPPSQHPLSSDFCSVNFQLQDLSFVSSTMKDALGRCIMWKNVSNYQEIVLRFRVKVQLHEFLVKESETYIGIMIKKQMKSQLQLKELDILMKECIFEDFQTAQHKSILDQVRSNLMAEVKSANSSLLEKCLQEVKEHHFLQAQTLQQLKMKKTVAAGTLEQYGISTIYIDSVTGELQQKLYQKQIFRLHEIVKSKQIIISTLEAKIFRKDVLEKEFEKQLQEHRQKNLLFRQLNEEFMLTNQNLDREKQSNRKSKLQIQALIIQQRSREQNEDRLERVINRISEEKSSLCLAIQELKKQNEKLQGVVSNKNIELKILSGKLEEAKKLENQSWKAIESGKEDRLKYQHCHKFSKDFEANLEAFKSFEIEKVNYILKRNYVYYEKCLKKNEFLEQQLAQLTKQLNQEIGLKQELKLQVQYFQKLLFRENTHQTQVNIANSDLINV